MKTCCWEALPESEARMERCRECGAEINLVDFATFSLTFGGASTNTPPNCP